MKNAIHCPNCKAENAYFKSVCSSCNSYLRDKIYNIDLWNIISLLIENPSKAFQKIIYSEHKNFIIFIILFTSVKVLITSRFVSMISLGQFSTITALPVSFLMILAVWVIYLILFTFLLKIFLKFDDINTRFKDNLAIIVYAQLPVVFALIFLFPIELIVFGDYIFSVNPSPFVIKEFTAYILAGFEIILIGWSVFLFLKAIVVQSSNMFLSFVITILFYAGLNIILYYSSKIIFTI